MIPNVELKKSPQIHTNSIEFALGVCSFLQGPSLFAGARGRSSTMPCLLILIQCQVASDGNAAHICSPIHFSLQTDCWLCAKSATSKNRFPSDGGTSCSLVDSMKMQFLKMWWRRFFPLEQRFDIDDLIYCWIFTLQGQLVGWLWDNRWSAATAWKSQVFFWFDLFLEPKKPQKFWVPKPTFSWESCHCSSRSTGPYRGWRSQSKSLKLADPGGEMGSKIDQQRSRLRNMGMDQYLLIPFLGEWTSISPSYFDVNYRGTIGFDTLPYWYWPLKKGVILCNICHIICITHCNQLRYFVDEVNNHWGHSVQSWCCGQLTFSAAKQFKRPFHLTPSNGGGFGPRCLNARCRFRCSENLRSRVFSNISLEKWLVRGWQVEKHDERSWRAGSSTGRFFKKWRLVDPNCVFNTVWTNNPQQSSLFSEKVGCHKIMCIPNSRVNSWYVPWNGDGLVGPFWTIPNGRRLHRRNWNSGRRTWERLCRVTPQLLVVPLTCRPCHEWIPCLEFGHDFDWFLQLALKLRFFRIFNGLKWFMINNMNIYIY